MSKKAVISEILALPNNAPREILALLQNRFAEDDLELSPKHVRELDHRLDTREREGSTGEKWEVFEKRLLRARTNARHRNCTTDHWPLATDHYGITLFNG
jgi:hypothetical protein